MNTHAESGCLNKGEALWLWYGDMRVHEEEFLGGRILPATEPGTAAHVITFFEAILLLSSLASLDDYSRGIDTKDERPLHNKDSVLGHVRIAEALSANQDYDEYVRVRLAAQAESIYTGFIAVHNDLTRI